MQIAALNGASQSSSATNQVSTPKVDGTGQDLPTSAKNVQSAAPAPNYTPLQFSNAIMSYLLTTQESTQAAPSAIWATPDGETCSGPGGLSGLPPGVHVLAQSVITNAAAKDAPPNSGGLPVSDINPTGAAKMIINTIGSNGELTLSDVDKMFGITTQQNGPGTAKAIYAADWSTLADETGVLTESQLSALIANRL
jgi:hypothetical protein